jgi:hypothetical protein
VKGDRPRAIGFRFGASIDDAHEFVASVLGLTLRQIAGAERMEPTLSFGVVIENYPSFSLPASYLLEASFLKSASQLRCSC